MTMTLDLMLPPTPQQTMGHLETGLGNGNTKEIATTKRKRGMELK